jgi:uncharacterized LabA/DUF88 family protein
MIRFMIFVDGSNLHGSLRELGLEVNDYQAFFKYIHARAAAAWSGGLDGPSAVARHLVRTYWYVVGDIDTWDFDNPDTRAHLFDRFMRSRELKERQVVLTERTHPEVKAEDVAKVAFDAWYAETASWYGRKTEILDGMRRFYHSVRRSTDQIDIIECGHWKPNFSAHWVDEKGLDTALAVDMLALKDSFDVAVIISGDADMIPSISHLKRMGKQVMAVEFIRGPAHDDRGRGFSSRMRLVADFVPRIADIDLLRERFATRRNVDFDG